MVSKKFAVVGLILLFVAINLINVTSRIDEVYVGVIYDRPWQGAISDLGSMNSWGAQESYAKLFKRPEGTAVWIISANAQKMDGSNDELKILIWYEDNNGDLVTLARAVTSQPYGMAQVACQIKKP